MNQISFSHLHSHTEFSLLDGSNRIKDYLDYVKELGMTSAAITDHGVMYGAIEFYKYAKSIGIHPVLGCEVYLQMDSTTGHVLILKRWNNIMKVLLPSVPASLEKSLRNC